MFWLTSDRPLAVGELRLPAVERDGQAKEMDVADIESNGVLQDKGKGGTCGRRQRSGRREELLSRSHFWAPGVVGGGACWIGHSV